MIRLLSLIVLFVLISGCSDDAAEVAAPDTAPQAVTPAANEPVTYGDEGIGIRKETLFEEDGVEPPEATFTTMPPGTGIKLERAYLDAPPQIPHSTAGLLPITKSANMCTSCHMPAIAAAVRATAIPESHMNEEMLSNARYNCSQCHVPQADVAVLIDNTF